MIKLSIDGLPQKWLFPTTRYRGSKRKILPWIWTLVKELPFDNALDLFGGTGIVSLLFKWMGKQVIFNDYLNYSSLSATALIQNSGTKLTGNDVGFLLSEHKDLTYNSFIKNTFKGIYFLDNENEWLDRIATNIAALDQFYKGDTLLEKKAISMWALGQACLIKRPFNLFHRKNLNLRTKNVERKFGNKTTWETPFDVAFKRFVEEANAVIFDNNCQNKVYCLDAIHFPYNNYDLVYLDPPYFFKNQRDPDYLELYHFLEGITQLDAWSSLIDYNSINLRFKNNGVEWPARSRKNISKIYEKLIERFKNSIIVISHKSGSLVSARSICKMLSNRGKTVQYYKQPYKYALSKKNGKPNQNIEWLIIGH